MNKKSLFLYDSKGSVVRQIREKRDGLYDIGEELKDVDYSTLLDYAAEKRLEIHGRSEMNRREIERLDRQAMIKKASVEADDVERFEEIMDEIEELVNEAYEITRLDQSGRISRGAEAFWLPQILGTVRGRSSMLPMSDTLNELREGLSGSSNIAGEEERFSSLDKFALGDFPNPRKIQEIIDKESKDTDIAAEAFVRKNLDRGVNWYKELLWLLYSQQEDKLYNALRKTLALPEYKVLAPALRTASVNPTELNNMDKLRRIVDGKPMIYNVRSVGRESVILSKPRFKGMMGDIMGEREVKIPFSAEEIWRQFEPAGSRVSKMRRILGFDPEEERLDWEKEQAGEARRRTFRPRRFTSPEEDAWPEAEALEQEWIEDAKDALATDKLLSQEEGFVYPVMWPDSKTVYDIRFGIEDAIVEISFELVRGYRGDYVMKVVQVGNGGTDWSPAVLKAVEENLEGEEFSFFDGEYESGGAYLASTISNIFSELYE